MGHFARSQEQPDFLFLREFFVASRVVSDDLTDSRLKI